MRREGRREPVLESVRTLLQGTPGTGTLCRPSLKQDVYNAYFQNADIKPYGRYFLKELVYSVALMDSQRILIGAQPLGSWGRDEEMREFARAYCSLPALPFRDVAGMKDPVTARYLNTANGTYVYLANLIWSDVSAGLRLTPGVRVRDVSTGQTFAAGPGGALKVPLRPYQLRTFLVRSPRARIAGQGVSVPERVRAFYQAKLKELSSAADLSARSGQDMSACRSRINRISAALAAGQYGEAHRLAFSKRMNMLLAHGR